MGKRIYEMSLIELFIGMEEAVKEDNQLAINYLAKELAYREYIPFQGPTMEDLLIKYGYKVIEKPKDLGK